MLHVRILLGVNGPLRLVWLSLQLGEAFWNNRIP
jgi:hypothetical protein